MPTPQGVRTVTLRGRYVEPDLLGTSHSGILTFTPNVPMVIFPVENTLMAGTEIATLDGNGEFIIDLPCTDTPGQNPINWAYTVTEKIVGVKPRTFQIVLNFTLEVMELSDLIPSAQAPDYIPVIGPPGPSGVVQSINGYSFTDVILTAEDVDAVPDSGPSVISGVKTFTSSPLVPTPLGADEAATKGYVDVVDGSMVRLTGNQNVAGIKTFTSIPVLPASDPTTSNQVTRKDYVDTGLALKADASAMTSGLALKADASAVTSSLALKADSSTVTSELALKADDSVVVKLTGAQTVAGLKTFSTIPVLPSADPTTTDQAVRKGYVDPLINGTVKLVGAQTVAGLKTFTDGIISGGVGQIQCAIKSADTSRASTAVVAADPHLTVPVAANAQYILEVVGVWTNGGGGFRCSFTGPAGATMVWTDNDGGGVQALGTDSTFMATLGTTFQGALITTGTAGTLTFRWGQNTSNAGATILKAGCYLKATRVG